MPWWGGARCAIARRRITGCTSLAGHATRTATAVRKGAIWCVMTSRDEAVFDAMAGHDCVCLICLKPYTYANTHMVGLCGDVCREGYHRVGELDGWKGLDERWRAAVLARGFKPHW